MFLWGFLNALGALDPAAFAAFAMAAAVLLVVATARGLPGRPASATATATGTALGRRAWGQHRPRLLDPDAAGRPRPRAPSPGRRAA